MFHNKKSKEISIAIVLLAILWIKPYSTLACDADDALPGALPPAPNGGQLGEVKGLDKDKVVPSEQRLYWEGIYSAVEKKIHLFAVKVLPPKNGIFTVLSPEKNISDLKIKVELIRLQQFVSVPFLVSQDRITVDFDAKGSNRFLVHLEGKYPDGEIKKAVVQIEEE
jgi:hypothetical protein